MYIFEKCEDEARGRPSRKKKQLFRRVAKCLAAFLLVNEAFRNYCVVVYVAPFSFRPVSLWSRIKSKHASSLVGKRGAIVYKFDYLRFKFETGPKSFYFVAWRRNNLFFFFTKRKRAQKTAPFLLSTFNQSEIAKIFYICETKLIPFGKIEKNSSRKALSRFEPRRNVIFVMNVICDFPIFVRLGRVSHFFSRFRPANLFVSRSDFKSIKKSFWACELGVVFWGTLRNLVLDWSWFAEVRKKITSRVF